jgi:hypothetical protein
MSHEATVLLVGVFLAAIIIAIVFTAVLSRINDTGGASDPIPPSSPPPDRIDIRALLSKYQD